MKFVVAYLYPNHLNLYGDIGNVEILKYRAVQRNIESEIKIIDLSTKPSNELFSNVSVVVMGGGPDSAQKEMADDFILSKGPYLKEFIENNGFGLFICGSYQLLGEYYKASDGTIVKGLNMLPLYTEHFGPKKPRCIGNVFAKLNSNLTSDPFFDDYSEFENSIVGFENHGGRTYLRDVELKLATVTKGFGNNGEDKSEGIHYKNLIGTYFHGPFLSKNPHIADYIILKSLKLDKLSKLDDRIIVKAFTASKSLKRV